MKHTLLKLSIAGMLCLLLAPMAWGQAASDKGENYFTCLQWGELPMQEIYYKSGEAYLPLTLKKRKRSQQYVLKTTEQFELYISEKNEAGEQEYQLVGASPQAQGADKTLFIVLAEETPEGLPLRLYALDDTLQGFPPGTFKFINFTESPLNVKVRDQLTQVAAGKISVVSSQAVADGGLVPLNISNLNGEMNHFTRLYAGPRTREMMFIAKSDHPKKKYRFMFIPQNIPVPKPASPPE